MLINFSIEEVRLLGRALTQYRAESFAEIAIIVSIDENLKAAEQRGGELVSTSDEEDDNATSPE